MEGELVVMEGELATRSYILVPDEIFWNPKLDSSSLMFIIELIDAISKKPELKNNNWTKEFSLKYFNGKYTRHKIDKIYDKLISAGLLKKKLIYPHKYDGRYENIDEYSHNYEITHHQRIDTVYKFDLTTKN